MPGPSAELMFTPLELGFAVDATLSVEFLANREARSRWRSAKSTPTRSPARNRRAITAPRWRAPSALTSPASWRRCSVAAIARRSCAPRCCSRVAGRESEQLEERVARLRESYGRVQLHRPSGEQHRLFLASLPAATFPLPEYKEHLLPDQIGAMVPHAISHAGSRDRPLHRPHPDRLAPAGPVRPRRGLPAEPPADLPARRQPRLGQDDLPRAGGLAGLPAGLGADRRHRPQGRSPPRGAARRRRGDRDDRALRAGALPRPARPDAGRRPRRPARTSPTTSWSRSCRRRSSPSGRPSCDWRSPRRRRPARAAAARCWRG